MWYNGLSTKSTSKESDETEPSSKKRKVQATKDEEVQKIVEKLTTKHGTNFTTMQLRIWVEMINGGLYSSYDNPPATSMFSRAGSASKENEPLVNQVIVDAANAITLSFSARATSVPSTCNSPSKLNEDHSKLYKQLSELHSLKSANALSEEEYKAEKKLSWSYLRNLKDTTTTS